jgi:Anthranilate/para-aminobenzoate synthases component I
MLRERIQGWVDPAAAFIDVFGTEEYAFWLDAGADAHRGTTSMGAAGIGPSVLFARAREGAPEAVVRLDPRTGGRVEEHDDLFDVLRQGLEANGARERRATGSPGWVGWFGYEFGAAACGAPIAARPPYGPPDAAWMRVDRFVVFEHADRTVTVCARASNGAAEWLEHTANRLLALIGASGTRSASERADGHGAADAASSAIRRPVRWRHTDADYLDLIRRAQEHITAGDAYQLCLTNAAIVEARIDPLDTYLRLRASSPTANGGYLRFGDWALASASPEQFLHVSADGIATTRPIKGTRPRGVEPSDDDRLRRELAADEKERAENLMIVDLMRNDLGRVARLGTVAVTGLLEVESYRQVHQLVSTVTAQLAEGVDALDVVRACFPAGSMTGTPKLAAMRILHTLEVGPRGPYAGSFGRIGDDGSLDLAMTIRSILIGPHEATVGAGGGITALSIPPNEVEEVALKARALLMAADAADERRTDIL